jgi:hypothetical protein
MGVLEYRSCSHSVLAAGVDIDNTSHLSKTRYVMPFQASIIKQVMPSPLPYSSSEIVHDADQDQYSRAFILVFFLLSASVMAKRIGAFLKVRVLRGLTFRNDKINYY